MSDIGVAASSSAANVLADSVSADEISDALSATGVPEDEELFGASEGGSLAEPSNAAEASAAALALAQRRGLNFLEVFGDIWRLFRHFFEIQTVLKL